MNIICIKTEPTTLDLANDRLLSELGATVTYIKPSFLDIATIYNINRFLKKKSIDTFVVYDKRAVLIASEYKKKDNHIQIVYHINPDRSADTYLSDDIIERVDTFIFPSEAAAADHKKIPHDKIAILPQVYSGPLPDTPLPYPTDRDTIKLVFMGDIVDSERLKQYLEMVDKYSGKIKLRICGAGRAAVVMPAVRLSRSLRYHDSVSWSGEIFDPIAELSGAHAMVCTTNHPTVYDSLGNLLGLQVLLPEQIDTFIESPGRYDRQPMTPNEYAARLMEIYRGIKK